MQYSPWHTAMHPIHHNIDPAMMVADMLHAAATNITVLSLFESHPADSCVDQDQVFMTTCCTCSCLLECLCIKQTRVAADPWFCVYQTPVLLTSHCCFCSLSFWAARQWLPPGAGCMQTPQLTMHYSAPRRRIQRIDVPSVTHGSSR